MQAHKWWEGLGNVGMTAVLRNAPATATNPAPIVVDFTAVTDTKFRIEPTGAAAYYWTGVTVGSPTTDSMTVQHVFAVNDLTLGGNTITPMASTDGGTTWYVFGSNTLTVDP